MKKLTAFIMAVLISLSMAGCSSGEENSQPENEENAVKTEVTAPEIQELTAFMGGLEPDKTATAYDNYFQIFYALDAGEETVMQQYMDAVMGGGYGLNMVDVYTNENDNGLFKFYYFDYSGPGEEMLERNDADHDITIGIAVYEDTASAVVSASYVKGFQYVDDGHRADFSKVVLMPTPTPQPTPTPVPAATPKPAIQPVYEPAPAVETVDKNASYIPDFTAFMNRSPSEDKDRYHGGNRKYYQKIPLETQSTVVAEILALLDRDRFQLELIEKVESGNRIDYNYRYTGNVAMDMIHSKSDDSRYYNLQFTVYNKNNDNGTYGVHFHYSPQFIEENVGYTVSSNTASGAGGGGGTPDFEGGDLPDHSKLQCLTCGGDGDCNRCGGDGYIIKDDIKSDCTRCTSGNCPTCGGSGTRS